MSKSYICYYVNAQYGGLFRNLYQDQQSGQNKSKPNKENINDN